ncbi:MAG TPA: YdjY domain-containing protein, partial [Luteolibacter sp.]
KHLFVLSMIESPSIPPATKTMHCLAYAVCCLLPCMYAAAQAPVEQTVAPDKGAVDGAGKFISAHQATSQSPADAEADEKRQRASLLVKPEGPNCYRIGEVTFDRVRREITIPAIVNMDSGAVEYALVAESGKVHEALFTTKANPREIHLACLLLGIPAGNPKNEAATPVEVKIHVSWDTNGPMALHELANLVVMADQPDAADIGTPLAAGPWSYVSSQMTPVGFAAAAEGSVISLITDPSALVINPRLSAQRDDIHKANSQLIPPKGSPVRIIFTLPASSAMRPSQSPPQR